MDSLPSLFAELKRRRVFRVAAVYAVAAFVIAQVADIFLPGLNLPAWTVTLVLALLILGFPLALALAWVFDITPQGVVRTEPLEEAEAEPIRRADQDGGPGPEAAPPALAPGAPPRTGRIGTAVLRRPGRATAAGAQGTAGFRERR